ncbi:cysteine-rich receptor-like protein kinase 44 [Syzygium oleosum]|uniref:cysteine-rich receptor-like protein kinase 44 n=1 Tax=Syzygium oleosum TaxID=219896 RepID=UPI0011D1F744|nr:cysteine-rich receptor-like protein kinase 44 [Syzygium oleosum]
MSCLARAMAIFSSLYACLKRHKPAACGGGGGAGRAGEGEAGDESSPSLFFDHRTLQVATGFFSELNQLGHGGFGPVFKGLMPNGQEIAVKKLSLTSRQGMREFTNEVKLLLKIQHRNLVMLMGCCVEGPEKMLVYEYLSNKSLDRFLFAKEKSASLDWITRFRIITGVARGLLYLHEEAPERIIHGDIKASNILLDDQLNPKISDFGLARLFPGDHTHLNTFKISGDYGYMAPEYAMRGYLSVKTDVFSYGVLVLEIVSGRKNHDSQLGGDKTDLLSYTWKLFQQGKSLDLVDSSLAKYNPDEAAMSIQLGLLCCQASYAERPDMNSVHLMLSSDSFTLPGPGKPGLQGRTGRWTTTATSAFTNTNASSTQTGASKVSTGSSLTEEYSRNSISTSSIDEGKILSLIGYSMYDSFIM